MTLTLLGMFSLIVNVVLQNQGGMITAMRRCVLFRKGTFNGLFIACPLKLFQQFTGIEDFRNVEASFCNSRGSSGYKSLDWFSMCIYGPALFIVIYCNYPMYWLLYQSCCWVVNTVQKGKTEWGCAGGLYVSFSVVVRGSWWRWLCIYSRVLKSVNSLRAYVGGIKI